MDLLEVPLPELVERLHQMSRDQTPLTTETTAVATILQARVAWESAARQDELVKGLVRQTRLLVWATWVVAAAGAGSVVVGVLARQ